MFNKLRFKLYNIIGRGSFKEVKIMDINTLKPFKVNDEYKCFENFTNNVSIKKSVNTFKFKDCIINSRSSAILVGNNLYVDRINANESIYSGFINTHNSDTAIVNLSSVENISEGFFLAGLASYNWFHWLTEILPKILFFDQSITKTVLVDSAVKEFPSMMESLKQFVDLNKIELIVLESNRSYAVEKLIYVSDISKVEYNPVNKNIIARPQCYFRPEILKIYSEIMISKGTNKNFTINENIYLIRKGTHRILNNQDEVGMLLSSYGFVEKDLMKMDFYEQIFAFQNAKIIVGISGAAWTNLIFAIKSCKAVIFSPDNYTEFSGFKELADIFNVDLQHLYYNNQGKMHQHSGFDINIKELNEILIQLNLTNKTKNIND